jgi:hypothetical protein
MLYIWSLVPFILPSLFPIPNYFSPRYVYNPSTSPYLHSLIHPFKFTIFIWLPEYGYIIIVQDGKVEILIS